MKKISILLIQVLLFSSTVSFATTDDLLSNPPDPFATNYGLPSLAWFGIGGSVVGDLYGGHVAPPVQNKKDIKKYLRDEDGNKFYPDGNREEDRQIDKVKQKVKEKNQGGEWVEKRNSVRKEPGPEDGKNRIKESYDKKIAWLTKNPGQDEGLGDSNEDNENWLQRKDSQQAKIPPGAVSECQGEEVTEIKAAGELKDVVEGGKKRVSIKIDDALAGRMNGNHDSAECRNIVLYIAELSEDNRLIGLDIRTVDFVLSIEILLAPCRSLEQLRTHSGSLLNKRFYGDSNTNFPNLRELYLYGLDLNVGCMGAVTLFVQKIPFLEKIYFDHTSFSDKAVVGLYNFLLRRALATLKVEYRTNPGPLDDYTASRDRHLLAIVTSCNNLIVGGNFILDDGCYDICKSMYTDGYTDLMDKMKDKLEQQKEFLRIHRESLAYYDHGVAEREMNKQRMLYQILQRFITISKTQMTTLYYKEVYLESIFHNAKSALSLLDLEQPHVQFYIAVIFHNVSGALDEIASLLNSQERGEREEEESAEGYDSIEADKQYRDAMSFSLLAYGLGLEPRESILSRLASIEVNHRRLERGEIIEYQTVLGEFENDPTILCNLVIKLLSSGSGKEFLKIVMSSNRLSSQFYRRMVGLVLSEEFLEFLNEVTNLAKEKERELSLQLEERELKKKLMRSRIYSIDIRMNFVGVLKKNGMVEQELFDKCAEVVREKKQELLLQLKNMEEESEEEEEEDEGEGVEVRSLEEEINAIHVIQPYVGQLLLFDLDRIENTLQGQELLDALISFLINYSSISFEEDLFRRRMEALYHLTAFLIEHRPSTDSEGLILLKMNWDLIKYLQKNYLYY